MSIARRIAFAASTLSLAACAGLLGLRDIDDGDPPKPPASDGAPADAMGSQVDAGDGSRADAESDARVPSDCDRHAAALLCDGFEQPSGASPAWRKEFQGGGGNVAARPSATDAGTYPNLHDFAVGFAQLPPVGKAALAFDGLPAGRRSLRFSVWIPSDSYPAHLPLGGLVDATGAGVVVGIDAPDGGGDRSLNVQDTRIGASSSIDLGPISFTTWTCIELEIASGALRVWRDHVQLSGTIDPATAASAQTAEVGLTWTAGAGASSIGMHYDDVVIATGAVGCD